MVKQEIKKLIAHVLLEMGINLDEIQLDYPNSNNGDYSTNLAMKVAKQTGKNPINLAEEIAEKLLKAGNEDKLLSKVEVAKPGFINMWIDNSYLMKIYPNVGLQKPNMGKKVVVEYSSPNIAKPFTIGHLRSTIIGDAIANILEFVGYTVYRDNHIGDWGTQFGKQIYAIKQWGDEQVLDKSDRPVKLLVDLYIKFHEEAEKDPQLEEKAREWFKKLEDGDIEARQLWKKCIEWSWKEFDLIYRQLEVSFTENNGRGYGEAFFEDKMATVITELQETGLLQEGREGAKIVSFPQETNLPPLMIIKKDGASLYSTRDLATDKFRIEKYGKEILVINEVGAEQALYFRQLYKLEEILGWFSPNQRLHVKHGLFKFKEGKMSTRKGNVIWLEEVLKEAEKRAWGLQKHTSEFLETETITKNEKVGKAAREHILGQRQRINIASIVGVGAIKWNDLKRSPDQDILFDWDEVLTMQGNSGPYLQYTFARTQSVLRKAGKDWKSGSEALQIQAQEREVLRLLVRFDEVVLEAAKRFAPNALCTYLFELAQAYNLFYQKHQILNEEKIIRDFRLSITAATGTILEKGLNLLGIQAPQNM